MKWNCLLVSVVGAAVLSLGACSGSVSPGGGSNGSVGGNATQAGNSGLGGAAPTGGMGSVGGAAGSVGGGAATGGSATAASDPYTTYRQLCVDTINSFRATLGRAPLVAWPAINTCVDGQSTADETAKTAHSAFGNCRESAQDECLGSNNTSRLVACLTSMWNEKNNAACSGCDACSAASWRTCANCDYNTCGHYVNMSAQYYTQVSCGFSSLGGWSTQDFK